MKYQQGKRDEDHLAAIMFNAMALIHYEEMIERGRLPAALNDMPSYRAGRQGPQGRQRRSQPQGGRQGAALIHPLRPCDSAGPEATDRANHHATYPGLLHLNGNLLVLRGPGDHGPASRPPRDIQIACVPLDPT